MNPTRDDWKKYITPGLSKPANLFFESELIEFGAKALDRIEVLEQKLESVLDIIKGK